MLVLLLFFCVFLHFLCWSFPFFNCSYIYWFVIFKHRFLKHFSIVQQAYFVGSNVYYLLLNYLLYFFSFLYYFGYISLTVFFLFIVLSYFLSNIIYLLFLISKFSLYFCFIVLLSASLVLSFTFLLPVF